MFRLTAPGLDDRVDPSELDVFEAIESIQYSVEPVATLEDTETGASIQAEHQCLRRDGGDPDVYWVEWQDTPDADDAGSDRIGSNRYRVVEQSEQQTIDLFLAFLEQDEGLLNEPDWMDLTDEIERERATRFEMQSKARFADNVVLALVGGGLVVLFSFLAWLKAIEG